MAFFTLRKSPVNKLRETKATLLRWISEAQAELDTTAGEDQDALWRLDYGDNITSWTAQIALVDTLLIHPEQSTAKALEDQLRARFRRRDEIDAALEQLPCFDEPEDELDYDAMESNERIHRKAVHTFYDEQFVLDRQCDLLACFLGISQRRIYEVKYIISAHHQNEEMRKLTKKEEAATYYPTIRIWMDGTNSLKTLSIAAKFSSWMTEYKSTFPTLI